MERHRLAPLAAGVLLFAVAGCGRPAATPTPRADTTQPTAKERDAAATAPSESGAAADQAAASSAATEPPEIADPPADEDFQPEEGFTQLTLQDFTPFPTEASGWRAVGGVIVGTGHPKGYLSTRRTYSNFVLRAEFQFVVADDAPNRDLANTGILVHIQSPDKVWPRCLEVQGKFPEMASIKSNGGVPDVVIHDDAEAREAARRPVGEWNEIEIESSNGALTATLNGRRICSSEPGELTAGRIGLQAELFGLYFRRLRIREDNP